MRSLYIVLTLAGVSLASVAKFRDFATKFNKKYTTIGEYEKRRDIFLANYNAMVKHNTRYEAGEVSWWRKVTQHSDLTHEEWLDMMRLGMPALDKSTMVDTVSADMEEKVASGVAPEEWNWVEQGAITSVKDQAQCGSCAAFATIATIDSCFWAATNGTLFDDLSEQHLMDCARHHHYHDEVGNWDAAGCNGAWPQAYYDWIVSNNNGKVEREDCAPYQAEDGNCRTVDDESCNYAGVSVTSFYNKWYSTEEEMKELVFMAPTATSVMASYWGDYGGGVYDDERCCESESDPNCIWTNNHEVTAVGYGSENGKDYWLVKNSWGSNWGESGYIKIKRGSGHCGFGTQHIVQPSCEADL